MKPQASSSYVWIIRDEAESQTTGGLFIPDSNKVKPNTGRIQSVGPMVIDKQVKEGRLAIFNKNVGQEIEYDGITYTVLRSENEILGTDERKKTKIGRWIWFKWLKLKIRLKLIKID